MSPIGYEVTAEGICRITLADETNRNAVNLAFAQAFAEAARQAATDPGVRVIRLTATGRYFSVGGDLREFLAEQARIQDHVMALTDLVHAGVRHLCRAPVPVVVGLNGVAAGGGFSFVLAGDIVIAKKTARLTSGYTKSGLTPDCGATWLLPRLVGHLRAFEIMALNRTMTAEEAQSIGLVTQVVDDEAFEAELDRVCETLAAMPPHALGGLKRLMRDGAARSLGAHLDSEAEGISSRAASPDTIARLQAFLGG